MSAPPLIEQFNLRSRLRFNLEAGRIWLDENRMLLLHAKALGALRRELFDTLGAARARGLLLRMGFTSGQQDAELARKLVGEGDDFDVFRIGPQLHAFEGLRITSYNVCYTKLLRGQQWRPDGRRRRPPRQSGGEVRATGHAELHPVGTPCGP